MFLTAVHAGIPDLRLALPILAFVFLLLAFVCFRIQLRQLRRKRRQRTRIERGRTPRLIWSAQQPVPGCNKDFEPRTRGDMQSAGLIDGLVS